MLTFSSQAVRSTATTRRPVKNLFLIGNEINNNLINFPDLEFIEIVTSFFIAEDFFLKSRQSFLSEGITISSKSELFEVSSSTS